MVFLARAFIIIFLLAGLFSTPVLADGLTGKTIYVCGDGSGWPPYTYVAPDKPGQVQGYDVDVVREILAKHAIKVEFSMPSWKQCLSHAAGGHKYQIALSSSYSDERASKFLFTRKYYTSIQSYFYARKHFPSLPKIKSASDLFLYGQICGRYSYNYEGTGVLKNSQILRVSKTYKALISRTINGDCAFFLGRPSILLGFKLINQQLIDSKEIGYAPIPMAHLDDFYMLVSRKYPYAEELKSILDDGILQMEKSGRLKEILNRYYTKMQS